MFVELSDRGGHTITASTCSVRPTWYIRVLNVPRTYREITYIPVTSSAFGNWLLRCCPAWLGIAFLRNRRRKACYAFCAAVLFSASGEFFFFKHLFYELSAVYTAAV